MNADALHLAVAHAATGGTNATYNPYIAARHDLFRKLYPPVGPGFESRIAGFTALSGFSILVCLVYALLLFVRKERDGRVNWWLYKVVARPQGRTLVFNIRIVCVLACFIASLVILIFGISYAKVYVHHQAQGSFNRWRSLAWLPLTAQGYFISRCSLHAFLICLQDLQLFSMPRLVIYVYGGLITLLSAPALACSILMTIHGSRLWNIAADLLELLTDLAEANAITQDQLIQLAEGTAAIEHEKNEYHNAAIAVYAFITAILFLLMAVNAGSWTLCQLMQGRISAAEARLAATRDPPTAVLDSALALPTPSEELEAGWDGPTPLPTPTSTLFGSGSVLTRKELVRMTKIGAEEQEADGTVKERAEAVLAMKKALFDLRVISAVVGLTTMAQLILFIYVMVFVADNWLFTKPFAYNEAATLGGLWVNLIVVSGGMLFLIFNEVRYRSPAEPLAEPDAGAEMAMSPIL